MFDLGLLVAILNSIDDPVIATDAQGAVLFMNPAADVATQWDRNDAIGTDWKKVFTVVPAEENDIPETAAQQAMRVAAGGEAILVAHDGTRRPIHYSPSPIHDENGAVRGMVVVFRDISDRKRLEVELSHLAHHDPLTGLPNRLVVYDRLSQATNRANRNNTLMSILFLDLDRFKDINDSLGHAVGDKVLQEVSRRLNDGVRTTDTVARWGGDEYVIVLEEINTTANVTDISEKILRQMVAPIIVDGNELIITVSIGVVIYPLDTRDVDDLLQFADAAMYRSKERGRNNYQLYSEGLHAMAVERITMTRKLQTARQREEFALHYQPILEVSSGKIIGKEALLRWEIPEEGFISPDQFIPLAEDSGMIVSIGEWISRTACEQNQEWLNDEVMAGYVSINISQRQFKQRNLVNMIGRVLKETGLTPQMLGIELTESLLMDDTDESISTLSALKDLGVLILLDDFGTGYSSLSYLARFAFDVVKIDRSFILNIPDDSNAAAIATMIIDLARNLRLKVVAEGVETEAQASFLRTKGCDLIQGYLYSRPLVPGKFLPYLQGLKDERE